MGEILKPGLTLFIVSVVAAVCLGYVFDITKGPIDDQQRLTKATAMSEILSSATEFKEEVNLPFNDNIKSVDVGYKGSDISGYVIGVTQKGYGGDVDMLVAVDTNGVISGIKIVKHSETPGLGANATNPAFYNKFAGKSGRLTVIKSGAPRDNEIETITSATITTRAVTEGVNSALDFFSANLK